MLQSLNHDVCGIINEYLFPIDLYHLKYLNKEYFSYVTKKILYDNIILQITKRLQQVFQDDYDNFIEYMQLNQLVISGSFIVQCILNEIWSSDIDMYTFSKKLFLREKWTENYDVHHHCYDYEHILNIASIHNYYPKQVSASISHIQIIKLQASSTITDIDKFLDNNFDFDICKNKYTIVDCRPQLKIHTLHGILNRQCQPMINEYGWKKIDRMSKYHKRGFNFNIKPEHYITYETRIIPIIYYEDDINGKITEIMFLGTRYSHVTEKFENDHIMIDNFVDLCTQKCLPCTWNSNNPVIKHDQFGKPMVYYVYAWHEDIRNNCVFECNNNPVAHYHKILAVTDKKNNDKLTCHVIVMKGIPDCSPIDPTLAQNIHIRRDRTSYATGKLFFSAY